jgi:hypothetical protein
MKNIIAVSLILAVVGCASNPEAVAPSFHPAKQYVGLTCGETQDLYRVAEKDMAALAKKQRGARTGDAWSVFLLGVPTSAVFGTNVEGELAQAKGKHLALQDAMYVNCGSRAMRSNDG